MLDFLIFTAECWPHSTSVGRDRCWSRIRRWYWCFPCRHQGGPNRSSNWARHVTGMSVFHNPNLHRLQFFSRIWSTSLERTQRRKVSSHLTLHLSRLCWPSISLSSQTRLIAFSRTASSTCYLSRVKPACWRKSTGSWSQAEELFLMTWFPFHPLYVESL